MVEGCTQRTGYTALFRLLTGFLFVNIKLVVNLIWIVYELISPWFNISEWLNINTNIKMVRGFKCYILLKHIVCLQL